MYTRVFIFLYLIQDQRDERMESRQEVLNKIVSERADKIQSEALEQIKGIQERSEKELSRVVPDLMKQIECFPAFKMLGVLEIIRNGGIVETCDYENRYDDARWRLELGGSYLFYDGFRPARLGKGRYRVTLIMEKLGEEAEAQ